MHRCTMHTITRASQRTSSRSTSLTSGRSSFRPCRATSVADPKLVRGSAVSGVQVSFVHGKLPFSLHIAWSWVKCNCLPQLSRFLAEAVYDLQHRLRDVNSDLLIRFGLPEIVLENILALLMSRGDEIVGIEMQKEICDEEVRVEKRFSARVKKLGLPPIHFNDTKPLINCADLPFSVAETPDVFTPFRKKVEALGDKMVRPGLEMPEKFLPFPADENSEHNLPSDTIDDTDNYGHQVAKLDMENLLAYLLVPLKGSYEMKYADPRSSKHRSSAFPWAGGETSALERLDYYFLEGRPPPVARYKETRNMLIGHGYSTKMSPFLSIGCISPRKIYDALEHHEKKYGSSQNTYWVKFEMLWRDYFMFVAEKFGTYLFKIEGFEGITDPKMAEKKREEWRWWDSNDYLLKAWMRGRTGVPFIDANIIELRETGFMSNRGRQNVASFLTKDLYFDWRIGAEFFETHLIDYEPTANWGNWAYVAGVGNDPRASRQFNPIKQGRDYDAQGEYVRTWIVQLQNIPAYRIHTPWLLSDEEWRKYLPDQKEIAEKTVGAKSAIPTIVPGSTKLNLKSAHEAGIARVQARAASRDGLAGSSVSSSSGYNAGNSNSQGTGTDSVSSNSAAASDDGNAGGSSHSSSHEAYFEAKDGSGDGTSSGSCSPSDDMGNGTGAGSASDDQGGSGRPGPAGSSSSLEVPMAAAQIRGNSSSPSPSAVTAASDSTNSTVDSSPGPKSGTGRQYVSKHRQRPVLVGSSTHPYQPPSLTFDSSTRSDSMSSGAPSTPSDPLGLGSDASDGNVQMSQSESIAQEAKRVRKEDFEAMLKTTQSTGSKSAAPPGNSQSASALSEGMDQRADYLSSTPYPRKPLFEQDSWKPHYHRKDLGRRRNGAGGGNSRRLIRAPAGGWEGRA